MTTSTRWSNEKAAEWYARLPWLTGCNFIPSNAINQLEMWQAESFDPATIDREFGWAADLGFNTVRTFLHDLLWQADPVGFKQRIDCFLDISARYGIRPMLVFFDDCWNCDPRIGSQPAPRPGIHNSGWVQSPGLDMVNSDPSMWDRLERYVKDILTNFANDDRILLWDLYNEPGNSGNGERSLPLLRAVFEWTREVNPSQPLTAGIWYDNKHLNNFQLAASDIITFHNYRAADHLADEIAELELYGRPIICTEWMARTTGSLVATHLPVFAGRKVGCINWGLVSGKTNTVFPWQDLNNPMNRIDMSSSDECGEPELWFHDLFRQDGTPYDPAEVETFKMWAKMRTSSGVVLKEHDVVYKK
jgi:hypothetical protein